jgi:arabinan endo-1,5-alpha-L-arabinosidase
MSSCAENIFGNFGLTLLYAIINSKTMNINKIGRQVLLLMMGIFLSGYMALCQPPSHDPTHMVKDGGRYWIFTTGTGIWNMSSPDNNFSSWQAEPYVFPQNIRPAWISGYVPGFDGNYWAPEIIYMNGKWNIYYSCSTFGSQRSAIGVATTASIADSTWEDGGMVVYSDNTWNVNAIDPDIFKDNDGKVWLLYGSFWNGIVMTELDSLTGKPLDPHNLHYVANNRCEAGHLLYHNDYYYLFFNRGNCCRGIHSTYHILMGRSASPTGPFFDKDSVNTNENGGTVFLQSDGRLIGPGHFGFGEDRLTYHYYDGGANGAAKLKIATLQWENGWPVAVYNRVGSLADSIYVITNYYSKKVLEIENADTLNGTSVVQNTETMDTSQHWSITYTGNGYYKISPALAPDKALEVEGCSTSNNAIVQIGNYEEKECQQWYIVFMGNGVYRIMSRNSLLALEIANASTADGANAQQRSYNQDQTAQRWTFKYPTEKISAVGSVYSHEEFHIFPNPSDGSFTIEPDNKKGGYAISLEIYRIDGKLVYSHMYENTNTIVLTNVLEVGLYQVKITSGDRVMNQKLMVK